MAPPGPAPPPPAAPPGAPGPAAVPGGREAYAGFWLRLGGYFIDYLAASVASCPIGFALGLGIGLVGYSSDASEEDIDAIANVAGALLGLIVGWLYFALMESSSRQATLGKMVIQARVTDEDGERISFRQATLRYFAKAISALILCIGFIMIAFTERSQGLHDKIAHTLVVRNPPR